MTPEERVRASWRKHASEEFLREQSPLYWLGMAEYNYVLAYADRLRVSEGKPIKRPRS